MSGRPLKLLLVHPGASWSTADVEAGLRFGLQRHGVSLVQYRLDARIGYHKRHLANLYRRAVKSRPETERPTQADVMYAAGVGLIEQALRHRVDAVLVVSAMFLHPDVIVMLRRAGVPVCVLFTESPYDMEQELRVAGLVNGCWTNERSALEAFRTVNPRSGYLPHAWHPERHRPDVARPEDADVPAHDVVFVGTAFRERVAWLSQIDWSGIDLGLYGSWESLGSRHRLRPFVRGAQVDNRRAAALYRKAKIGLNLYRTSKGWGPTAPAIAHAESLNPRAYELAACGAFFISDFRQEHVEVFGDVVPTFASPAEAGALIRMWLRDETERQARAARLPALVAEATWSHRATTIIGDLQSLLGGFSPAGAARADDGEVSRQEGRRVRVDDRVGCGGHGLGAHELVAQHGDGQGRDDVVR